MYDELFARLRHLYLPLMMLATRICGSTGGVLVVYYVNLTLDLQGSLRTHFFISCAVVVVVAVILSLLSAGWETRALRKTLRLLERGITPDPALAEQAGREAVTFPVRHHRTEAWLVPCSTLLPVAIALRVLDQAPYDVLLNIALAVVMGVGLALMSTFFIIERLMQPVVRYLLDHGIVIDFERLPANRLRHRLNLCFGLVILITALMIGTLANRRASDIIAKPTNQAAAVANLRTHTTYITLAAIVVGFAFSSTISQSVASRVARLVQAMKRVEKGSLSEELRATGNDEIDVLTRQFNSMVQQLAQNDATIRDLNANLERKVEERTLTLRMLHAELDDRNTELETALSTVKEMQSQLVGVAHRAGMTEIAAGVLHNVGNVLNSVNVSVALLGESFRRSKVAGVVKSGTLIREQLGIAPTEEQSDKMRKIADYLMMLGESLQTEHHGLGTELANLTEKVQHIKNIISAQQTYTRQVTFKETVDVHSLLDDLFELHRPTLAKHEIEVVREYGDIPSLVLEKSKLLQVLDNLVRNALEAMQNQSRQRILRISSGIEDNSVVFTVSDTGHGISEAQLKNIFRFGFTTKQNGHGFGLHSSANAVSELGGTIRVASDGVDAGASFTITIPLEAKVNTLTAPQSAEQPDVAIGA